MSDLLATEHERGLHSVFRPQLCPECRPHGLPEPVPAVAVSHLKIPVSEGIENPETATATIAPGNLGEALARLRRTWVIDQPDEPPGPSTPDGEAECEACGGYRWLRPEASPGQPNFGRLIPCEACGIITRRRLRRMWGDLPEHFRGMRLRTYPQTVPAQRQLVERLPVWLESDRWLYLHGKPGRGKSGLAVSLLHELVRGGQSGLFKVVPDLLDRIRRTYRNQAAYDEDEQDVLDSLYGVDVLVLDDLGAEKSSDWASEKLFQVIGHRRDNHRRTIVTSNLDLLGLTGHLSHPRVASRIGELADVIDLSTLPNLR